jgi:hypothetical protein
VDLAPVVRAIILMVESTFRSAAGGNAARGAMAGPLAIAKQAQGLLANAELATWASHRAGDALTVRWRWPMGTFESAGNLVRQVMAMMGGPTANPPP